MRWILDTDLLTVINRRSQPAYDRLPVRLRRCPPDSVAVTIISFQEQVRGWLAYLNKARTPAAILHGYVELEAILRDFCQANVLPFDRAAQDRFADLHRHRLRIGTMDLRIAAIALATGATLLSRNLRDFSQVPGLVVEDWSR